MNALFVPDPNPTFKIRTWLGQIGIIVKGVEKCIQLVFTASTSEITLIDTTELRSCHLGLGNL